MCGGDSVSYTYNRTDLGLNIQRVEVYADGKHSRTDIVDTLRRPNDCCWARSPYNRPLSPADIELTQLNTDNHRAKQLIEERQEYMRRVEQEAEEDRIREEERRNRGCNIL